MDNEKPKLITRRDVCKGVAARYFEAYKWMIEPKDVWAPNARVAELRRMHAELVALGADPDPDDVARIVADGSDAEGAHWSTPSCDQCGRYVEAVVELTLAFVHDVDGNDKYQLCVSCCGELRDTFTSALAAFVADVDD